jgi:hypothetical protein
MVMSAAGSRSVVDMGVQARNALRQACDKLPFAEPDR